MERNPNKEQSVDEREAARFYNGAQILLIKYMLCKGLITSAEEYAEKYAEIFDLLASGAIQTRASLDWNKLRERVDKIRQSTLDKVETFNLFHEQGSET